jgi:hypothetical protein
MKGDDWAPSGKVSLLSALAGSRLLQPEGYAGLYRKMDRTYLIASLKGGWRIQPGDAINGSEIQASTGSRRRYPTGCNHFRRFRMNTFSFRRLLAGASALIVATACSDSTAPNSRVSDNEATADLAITAGDAIATDVGLLIAGEADGMTFTTAAQRGGAALAATTGCSLVDGRRVCTATNEGGMTITRSFAFYDATGTIQSAFDPATTASINFQMSLSGTLTRPHVTATITRQRNMTLSGLAGAETQRTWNGTGAGTENSTATGDRGTRTYAGVAKDTTTNVVFSLPRSEHPFPESGTVVHRIDATATFEGAQSGSRTISRRAVVTFNGTANVPLQVGNRSCMLNLTTKAVTCPTA